MPETFIMVLPKTNLMETPISKIDEKPVEFVPTPYTPESYDEKMARLANIHAEIASKKDALQKRLD